MDTLWILFFWGGAFFILFVLAFFIWIKDRIRLLQIKKMQEGFLIWAEIVCYIGSHLQPPPTYEELYWLIEKQKETLLDPFLRKTFKKKAAYSCLESLKSKELSLYYMKLLQKQRDSKIC